MNQEKQMWVDALRSGKYKQIVGSLKKDDCFCAYGVLCDLYSKCKNIMWEPGYDESEYILGHSAYVPNEVLDWAGCGIDKSINTLKKVDYIIDMNDKQKKSFLEIADYIEKEL